MQRNTRNCAIALRCCFYGIMIAFWFLTGKAINGSDFIQPEILGFQLTSIAARFFATALVFDICLHADDIFETIFEEPVRKEKQ